MVALAQSIFRSYSKAIKNLIFCAIHIKDSPLALALGPAMIKASLDNVPALKGKLETSILDFTLAQGDEEIAEKILACKPNFVGLSLYLWNRSKFEKIAGIIKAKSPGLLIFGGGPEATSGSLELLKTGLFDFVVRGEGEGPVVHVMEQLVEGRPVDGVVGVMMSKDTTEVPAAFESNLDLLPSPFLSGVVPTQGRVGVLWELSRGCPFGCSFCFESKGVSGVRRFSLERIEAELKLFEASGVTQVFVLDPTFNQDKARAKTILRIIKKWARGIHFTFEVRTEFLDQEMAALFGELNCSLQIGLQSTDPEVLRAVNRSFNAQAFKNKIDLLNQAGVSFGLDLIYGLPGDTLLGFKKSLDYALERQPNHLDIFQLALLPGTVLYDQRDTLGLTYEPRAPYQVLHTPTFSKDDLLKARSLAEACNVFYNKGGAVGWLFILLESLEIRSSEFLEQFSHRITQSPIRFVQELFERKGVAAAFGPIKNLIIYHDALSRSLFAGPEEDEKPNVLPEDQSVLKLTPGTILLTLDYHLDDILALGVLTLAEFIRNRRPKKTSVVIHNYRGQVGGVMIEPLWQNVLRSFDGKRTVAQIRSTLSPRHQKDFKEFLLYALSEGMITRISDRF